MKVTSANWLIFIQVGKCGDGPPEYSSANRGHFSRSRYARSEGSRPLFSGMTWKNPLDTDYSPPRLKDDLYLATEERSHMMTKPPASVSKILVIKPSLYPLTLQLENSEMIMNNSPTPIVPRRTCQNFKH